MGGRPDPRTGRNGGKYNRTTPGKVLLRRQASSQGVIARTGRTDLARPFATRLGKQRRLSVGHTHEGGTHMANLPLQGQSLPDLDLTTENGEHLGTADLKGQKTVLYFYPKDDTPGCTKEACAFR